MGYVILLLIIIVVLLGMVFVHTKILLENQVELGKAIQGILDNQKRIYREVKDLQKGRNKEDKK